MNIVLVHGFHVRDGGFRTVDGLKPVLESHGFEVDTDSADYGYHDLIRVRFFYKKAVSRIAAALQTADAVATHSNGANYTMKALEQVNRPITVVHVSPALNSKPTIPASVKHMHVFHTRNDSAVKAARWLLFHSWGSMGAGGYKGHDSRVTNHDYTKRVLGHSDWFRGLNTPFFAGRIAQLLEEQR